MNSFATNTVCSHDTLCPRERIEETVHVISRALHTQTASKPEPEKQSPATTKVRVSNRMTQAGDHSE